MGWQTLKCFLVFGPFFTLAVYSGGIYDDIRTNDIPSTVPQQATLKAGQGITAVVSSLALAWNFFELVPSSHFNKAGTFLFVSFVDFLIGTLLLLGVGLQSNYLPHTLAGCNIADQWGVEGQGNVTGLFRWVSTLDQDAPYDACQGYMTTWIMAIVLGAISLISSYGALQEAKDPPPRYVGGRRSRGIDVVGNLIGLTPRFVATPTKYGMRWLQKWCGRQSTTKKQPKAEPKSLPRSISLKQLPSQNGKVPSGDFKLIELVSSYPIMTAIAEGLHYADLIELSMVSKNVREAIFPSFNAAAKSNFEQYCCKGKKLPCWSCNIQVCTYERQSIFRRLSPPKETCCGVLRSVAEPIITSHLNNCAAYCSKCFRDTICNVAGPRELSPQCNCNTAPQASTSVPVCRFCYALDDKTLSMYRGQREKKKLAAHVQLQLTCTGCQQRLLKSGPRWWGCKRCGKECRSKFHPQWAGAAEA